MTAGAAALSFNEVEALATKAARGAGLGWGQAEDLGRSARWLAAHGFDWADALLALLDHDAASSRAALLMREADRASSARPGETWTVAEPAGELLVPLLAGSIYGSDVALTLRGPNGAVTLRPDDAAEGTTPTVVLDLGHPLAIAAAREAPRQEFALLPRPRPSPLQSSALARLSTYADRTAVPASETSRARGAGSTLSDND